MSKTGYAPTKPQQFVLAGSFARIPLLAGIIPTPVNAARLFR
jgi:hypothetical protein